MLYTVLYSVIYSVIYSIIYIYMYMYIYYYITLFIPGGRGVTILHQSDTLIPYDGGGFVVPNQSRNWKDFMFSVAIK